MSLSQSHLHSASWEAGRTHLAPVVSCCFFTANWGALQTMHLSCSLPKCPRRPKTQTQTVCCKILCHSFHAEYFCPDFGGLSDSFCGFLSCLTLGRSYCCANSSWPSATWQKFNWIFPYFSKDLVTPSSGLYSYAFCYHLDDQGRRMRQPQYLPQRVRPNKHYKNIESFWSV